MLQAIARHLPAGVQSNPPQGGLFVWLRLPATVTAEQLLPNARRKGVTFAPGNTFFPEHRGGENWLRLNFACQAPEAIEEGIKRLGRAIRQLGVH
jgi:DNA-binding transcriptional MocR family regulator